MARRPARKEKERNVLVTQKTIYNLEAEEQVLGSILTDGKCFKSVDEFISYEDFYDKQNQQIFRAMEILQEENTDIDVITVHDVLVRGELADFVGGATRLTELTTNIISTSKVATHAKMVADYATKRKIADAAGKIVEGSSSGSLEETLEIAKQQISEVNSLGGKHNKYQVASMADFIEESKERYANWGKMQGLSTGFPSIDDLTLGLSGGELIIIAGPTSKGKTLLAMSMANNITKEGGRVLFVTLEMTYAELTSRYMYINSGWDTDDFINAAANTIFQVNDELDWQDIDGLIQNAKEELDVDLVVIDHLHYLSRELQNVAEDLGRITKEFKKNAIRYNIPIILISHIRKLQKDEELSGDSLRGSSLIAQDADIVLMINRDPETNAMGVMIDKNRNRGKLSDRTRDWNQSSERELNTIFLDFNNTKLHDPKNDLREVRKVFLGGEAYKD